MTDFVAARTKLESGKYDVLELLYADIPALTDENILFDDKGFSYVLDDNGNPLYNSSSTVVTMLLKLDGVPESIDHVKRVDDSEYWEFIETEPFKTGFAMLDPLLKHGSVAIGEEEFEYTLLMYDYDYVYNGLMREAPFPSSMGQMVYLQLMLALYAKFPCQTTFDNAIQAAAGYAVSMGEGGFMYEFPAGEGIWFEEIPLQNPTHILNAQLTSIVSLWQARQLLKVDTFDSLIRSARQALESRFTEYYNCGNYARYDLSYRLHELMFRITPYAGEGELEKAASPDHIAVSSVQTMRKGEEADPGFLLDMVSDQAGLGACRIGGEWGAISDFGGRLARSVESKRFSSELAEDEWGLAGCSIMTLEFPMDGAGVPTLVIEYFDNEPGSFTVDMRNPHMGNIYEFIPVKTIQTTGDKTWKTASIEIPEKYLTAYIGPSYLMVHIYYLWMYQEIFDTNVFKDRIQQYAQYYLDVGDPIKGVDYIVPEDISIDRFTPTAASGISMQQVQALFSGAAEEPIELSGSVEIEGRFDEPYALSSVELKGLGNAGAIEKIELWGSAEAGGEQTLRQTIPGGWLDGKDTFAFRFPKHEVCHDVRLVISTQSDFSTLSGISFVADPDELYADQILLEATGTGLEDPTASYDRVLAISNYIVDGTELSYDSPVTLQEFYATPVGSCGTKAIILSKLLQYIGVPSRRVVFHNALELGDAHVTVEFFLYNQLNYIDSSYSMFVATEDSNLVTLPTLAIFGFNEFPFSKMFELAGKDYTGYCMFSLSEILQDTEIVDTDRYFGEYVKNNERSTALPNYESYCTGELYSNADPIFYLDGNDVAVNPVTIPDGSNSLAFGEYGPSAGADDWKDMIEPGKIPTQLYYIGLSDLYNVSQKYTLPADGVGSEWEIKIVPSYCSSEEFTLGISGTGFEVISQEEVRADFEGYRQGEKSFTFVVRQTESEAVVYIQDEKIDGVYIYVDAIRVNRLAS